MRNIITTIVLALSMICTTQAQENIKSGSDWWYAHQENLWDWTSGLAWTNGNVISGESGPKRPQLIVTKANDKGVVSFRLSRTAGFTNDDSFLTVSWMFDSNKSTLVKGSGITSGEADDTIFVYRTDKSTAFEDASYRKNLLHKMTTSKTVHVKIEGPNGYLVIKFDLDGSSKAISHVINSKPLDPFASTKGDDDPFKG